MSAGRPKAFGRKRNAGIARCIGSSEARWPPKRRRPQEQPKGVRAYTARPLGNGRNRPTFFRSQRRCPWPRIYRCSCCRRQFSPCWRAYFLFVCRLPVTCRRAAIATDAPGICATGHSLMATAPRPKFLNVLCRKAPSGFHLQPSGRASPKNIFRPQWARGSRVTLYRSSHSVA